MYRISSSRRIDEGIFLYSHTKIIKNYLISPKQFLVRRRQRQENKLPPSECISILFIVFSIRFIKWHNKIHGSVYMASVYTGREREREKKKQKKQELHGPIFVYSHSK